MQKSLATLESFFLAFCAIVFGLTGLGKAWLALSKLPVLNYADPVFGFPRRYVLWAAVIVELGTVAFIIWHSSRRHRLLAVIYVSSVIGFYRMALLLLNAPEPCPCLGKLQDVLHLTASQARTLLGTSLFLMLAGASIFLWLRWSRQVVVPGVAESP
jgi:hypothetical protein